MIIAVLAGAVLVVVLVPDVLSVVDRWSGPALLIGGALIGVPHGSSDFVVAHQLMRPRLGHLWLPGFVTGYLGLVGLIVTGWVVAPLATLGAFLVLSCLHFGWADTHTTDDTRPSVLQIAVRASTPLVPIFLLHPQGVAGLLASLGSVSGRGVLHGLTVLREPILVLWAAGLTAFAARGLTSGHPRRLEVAETLTIAAAAVVLPPLLCFVLYFCLVHAVRHMTGLADRRYPAEPMAAALLTASIVLPSAIVCFAILGTAWTGLEGLLDTQTTLCAGLRLVAALTVPHMLLEAAEGGRSRSESSPAPLAQAPG